MKSIDIELKKSQILNDVVARMNVLGRTLEQDENLRTLAGYIASPDDNETKPIVARALTEGFDRVKNVCQRFLVYGRTTDDNRLERLNESETVLEENFNDPSGKDKTVTTTLTKGTVYKITVTNTGNAKAEMGVYEETAAGPSFFNEEIPVGESRTADFVVSKNLTSIFVSGKGIMEIKITCSKDVTLMLALSMPNSFNEGVTSQIKSCAHHIIVANILCEFLRDQSAEKAGSYKTDISEEEDMLLKALNARRPFTRTSHDWS